MTSCGPNTQSLNYTYMFPSKIVKKKGYTKGSIMDLLNTHPDFTKFTYIVKLAELDILLDQEQANFTLFVPSDTELKYNNQIDTIISNMDKGDAKQLVSALLLDGRLPKEILTDSPASYYTTKNNSNRMFITNINGNTKINNDVTVLHFDIIRTNGIVHVVDKLINILKM